jgi:hypothetical protein
LKLTERAIASIKGAARSAHAYVEIVSALQTVQAHGLSGERPVAVVGGRFDIYVLEAAPPGWASVLVVNPANPEVITVADVGRYSDHSVVARRAAAAAAMSALKLVASDVYVIPLRGVRQ